MARTALLAGSFDPPTLGHLDLICRALVLVDRLVVGVGVHGDKSSWLTAQERVALLRASVPPEVEVLSFEGLAVDAARRAGASLLVRGVRSGAEAEDEATMAHANRRLASQIETVLLPASPDVAHIRARLVREVHASGGDLTLFVPAPVVAFLSDREPRKR